MSHHESESGNPLQWLWNKLRRPALPNEIDRLFYERAGEEIAAKQPVPWIWSKAFAESDGNLDRTAARYIRLRVAHLREQLEIAQRAEEQQKADAARDAAVNAAPPPPPPPTEQQSDESPAADAMFAILKWTMIVAFAIAFVGGLALWFIYTVTPGRP